MPVLTSEVLDVTHEKLIVLGAFDAFVDLDSALHVDPHLLQSSDATEFKGSYTTFQNYFKNTFKLIAKIRDKGDRIWRAAVNNLTFPELPGIGLGYSRNRAKGNAIGPKIAKQLVATAQEILAAGVEDPTIFELVGLLERNVGPDRISDMTIHITIKHVAAYTARIAKKLKAATHAVTIGDHTYELPLDPETEKPLFLLPQDILRDLPIALSWDAIDTVAAYNDHLREQVNRIIGDSWKSATAADVKKEDLKATLLKHPELLEELIERYKKKPTVPYDFQEDPAAEQRRYFDAVQLALAHPLALAKTGRALTELDALAVVLKICEHFGQLLEHNGLNELLYDAKKKPLRERAAQRLFYGVGYSYCDANGLDLTPESNAGRGPVDFKASDGSKVKVAVEMKLTTHGRLLHGYEHQLPDYMAAERTNAGVFLIVRVNDKITHIDAVKKSERDAKSAGTTSPPVRVVDARLRASASKPKPALKRQPGPR